MSGEPGGGDSPGPDAGGDLAAPAELRADRDDGDFGDLVRNKESEAASFEITNIGEEPSGVLSTALAGDAGAFLLESDDCAGAILGAEESCRIEVRFAPEAAGDHAATLEVAADPGGEAKVLLAGRGLEPGALVLDADNHDFGKVELGETSDPVSLVVENTGQAETGELILSLSDPHAFLVESDDCSDRALAPAEACTIEVVFSPEVAGHAGGSVTVGDSAEDAVAASLGGIGFARLETKHAGNGSGTIASAPLGIHCGNTCSASFEVPEVTLSATPHAGSTFVGWEGPCQGTGPCALAMTASQSVTARFELQKRMLHVSKTGSGAGTVVSSPAGIFCGSSCSASFDHGASVTLTATPGANSVFTGWSGACAGTAPCTVPMTSDRLVAASFAPVKRTLSVTKSGQGTGTVSSSPAGIFCGSSCSASFDHGTSVTLTAQPSSASVFVGWSGACSGSSPTCSVSMTANRSASATFAPKLHTLTVSKENHELGTVTSSPSGIHCDDTCSSANASYLHGTTVTLTATPKSAPFVSPKFLGWSGACSGTGTCTVSMTQARSVTAVFGF